MLVLSMALQVWNPINAPKFETLSYLPNLRPDAIAKQIDYMIRNGWIPCLEFDEVTIDWLFCLRFDSGFALIPWNRFI